MLLLDISSELLSQTFSTLSRHNLACLARTCRLLGRGATRHLYQSIVWRSTKFQPNNTARPLEQQLQLFLRTLSEKPSLGSLVENIGCVDPIQNDAPGLKDFSWSPPSMVRLFASEISTILLWVFKLGLSHYDDWVEVIRRGIGYAYALLSLAFCPNLQSLIMGRMFIRTTPLLGSVFAHVADGGPRGDSGETERTTPFFFPRLRNVHIGEKPGCMLAAHPERDSRFSDLIGIFFLPSLEHLTITLPAADDFDWTALTSRPQLRALTTLMLPHCEAKSKMLKNLLTAQPPLKELLYHYAVIHKPDNEPIYFDLTDLSSALRQVSTTLERLSVSTESYNDDLFSRQDDCPFTGTLESFAGFSALSELRIPLIFFKGVGSETNVHDLARNVGTSLSPSMRHLELSDEDLGAVCSDCEPDGWPELVRTVLASRNEASGGKGQLENLVCIGDGATDEEIREVEDVCAAFGVEGSLRVDHWREIGGYRTTGFGGAKINAISN